MSPTLTRTVFPEPAASAQDPTANIAAQLPTATGNHLSNLAHPTRPIPILLIRALSHAARSGTRIAQLIPPRPLTRLPFDMRQLGTRIPEICHFAVITFRSITVVFVLCWISTGIVFVAWHAGVAQLGDTIESFVVYYFCWRCASYPRPFGSTVNLVMSKEEIRARRDPAMHLAVILTGVVGLWQLAIIIAAPCSQTWVTYTAMLAIVPIVFFVARVAPLQEHRRRTHITITAGWCLDRQPEANASCVLRTTNRH